MRGFERFTSRRQVGCGALVMAPQYPPVRRLAAGLVKGKRARKCLVVQAARRLAIELWHLSTGQTIPEKLGLICTPPNRESSAPFRPIPIAG
jgi:hypothetical protein